MPPRRPGGGSPVTDRLVVPVARGLPRSGGCKWPPEFFCPRKSSQSREPEPGTTVLRREVGDWHGGVESPGNRSGVPRVQSLAASSTRAGLSFPKNGVGLEIRRDQANRLQETASATFNRQPARRGVRRIFRPFARLFSTAVTMIGATGVEHGKQESRGNPVAGRLGPERFSAGSRESSVSAVFFENRSPASQAGRRLGASGRPQRAAEPTPHLVAGGPQKAVGGLPSLPENPSRRA